MTAPFVIPTEHRQRGGERARLDGAPAVALAVQRAESLPELTPAPADHVLEQEPAAFSHLRQGFGGQARGGEG